MKGFFDFFKTHSHIVLLIRIYTEIHGFFLNNFMLREIHRDALLLKRIEEILKQIPLRTLRKIFALFALKPTIM